MGRLRGKDGEFQERVAPIFCDDLVAGDLPQTPPDLVVKFQRVDIADVILWLVFRPPVSVNGKSKGKLRSPYRSHLFTT
jgi:hypothetical protein